MATAGNSGKATAATTEPNRAEPRALPRQHGMQPVDEEEERNEEEEGGEEGGEQEEEEEEQEIPKDFTPQIIRFGYGSEGGIGSIFNINGENVVADGFPGLQGESKFIERFVFDPSLKDDIKEVMLKYWMADDNPRIASTISEPDEDDFKAPCYQGDIDILKEAFTHYKDFLEAHINEHKQESDQKDANKKQINRIDAYLEKLNSGPEQDDCVSGEPKTDISDHDYYYSILPKIFFLLHKHSQKGEQIQIETLLKEFGQMNHTADEYIEQLIRQGEYEGIDDDGISGAARSVKKLYNLLETMFPDIFNEHHRKEYSEEQRESINFDEEFGEDLEFLGDQKENALDILQEAFTSYIDGNTDTAKEHIKGFIRIFHEHIESLKPHNENGNKLTDFIDLLFSIVRGEKEGIETKLEELELNTNAKVKEIIERLNGSKCEITKETCKEFINEGKGEIYTEMLRMIDYALLELLQKIDPEIKGVTNEEYDAEKKLDDQAGIKELNKLINDTSNKFDAWKIQFEQPSVLPAQQGNAAAAAKEAAQAASQAAAAKAAAAQAASQAAAKAAAAQAAEQRQKSEERRRAEQSAINAEHRRQQELIKEGLAEKTKEINMRAAQQARYTNGSPVKPGELRNDKGSPLPAAELKNKGISTGMTNRARGVDYGQYVNPRERIANNKDVRRIRDATEKREREKLIRGGKLKPEKIKDKRSAWRGGSMNDVAIGPNDIPYLIAKQHSWEKVNSAYNNLEPTIKKHFPEPSSPPLYTIMDPFHRYINEYADPTLLEEADEHAKLMSPNEINDVFISNGNALKRLLPFYTLALPRVNSESMPNLIRAHLMRIL
jgi:hypothetical protein